MIKFMRSAVVVVACVAGFGAWGASVSVTNSGTVYASELFGEGHPSPEYPDGMTPVVVLTIPQDVVTRPAAGADTPADATDDRDRCDGGQGHLGEADITFTLSGGAVFNSNVSGLMWNPIAGKAGTIPAPGTVASIKEGGRKGDSSITITVKPAEGATTPSATSTSRNAILLGGNTTDSNVANYITTVWPDQKECKRTKLKPAEQSISFTLPQLANLDTLAGANILDASTKNDQPKITVSASSRIVSGAFPDGSLATGTNARTVISSRDAVTLQISPKNEKMIAIDGDSAFKSVKGANADGYVELATITIQTKHIMTPKKDAKLRERVGYLQDATTLGDCPEHTPQSDAQGNPVTTGTCDEASEEDQEIYNPGEDGSDAVPWMIYDLDGDTIDEGLRGVLMVSAMGTRDLFNEDDDLFIDYDRNKKKGSGEEIGIDGDSAMSNAFSVDPDKSDSFGEDGTGEFKVYYMPGGKVDINHEAMIKLTAMVHYSDPSANNEADAPTSTTLKFDGVGSPVRAYAIPHSTNSIGDKGNVRVRCEESAGCRVFLECWDDDGNRAFGEAPEIAGNNLMRWTGADIEGVTGMEPSTRHSCRVLSKGMVTVQQLTRDGNSGTLVNNTFVGGGM